MSENAAEDLLVKMLLQYPHRLTQEDREHLTKLKQEIMNTPLLTPRLLYFGEYQVN